MEQDEKYMREALREADAIVIGAGAAGMMAGIAAAKARGVHMGRPPLETPPDFEQLIRA